MFPPQTLLFDRNEWQCYDYGTLLILKPSNLQSRAGRLRAAVVLLVLATRTRTSVRRTSVRRRTTGIRIAARP